MQKYEICILTKVLLVFLEITLDLKSFCFFKLLPLYFIEILLYLCILYE